MKALSILLIILCSGFAYAGTPNAYDEIMLDCMDYYHPPVSARKEMSCHEEAKEIILENAQSEFLDCVDYYHSRVSLEKEAACLREVSKVAN